MNNSPSNTLERLQVYMPELFTPDGKLSLSLLETHIGKENMWLPGGRSNQGNWKSTEKKESEALYRAIMNASPDDITITDLEGRILMASTVAYKMFGYEDNGEITKYSITDFIVAEDTERALSNINLMFQGKMTGPAEYRGVRKDGSIFDIEVNGEFIRDPEGKPIQMVFVVRDITEGLRLKKQYKTLFNQMTEGFALHEIICDEEDCPVDYRFLAVNPAFEAQTGLKKQDLIGKTVLEVLPNTEEIWIKRYGKVAQTGKSITFEEYSKETGRFYQVSAFSPAPNQFASIVTDITSRKQAEKILKENHLQLEQMVKERTAELELRDTYLSSVINNHPGRFWMKDRNGRFLFSNSLNDKFMHLTLGLDNSGIIGKTESDLRTAQGAQIILKEDQEVISGKKVIIREELIKIGTKDFWFEKLKFPITDQNNQTIGIAGYSIDITDRKERDAQLRMRNEAFKSFALSIFITDDKGNIQWANPAFQRLTGYSLKEVIGKKPDILQSDKHDPEVISQLWKTIISGQVWNGELINRRKDGSLYYVETTITPVRNDLGEISHFIAIKVDITQRKEMEEALRKSIEKEKELNDIKSRFVANASHEFRTPLAKILITNDSLTNYWQKMGKDQIHTKLDRIKSNVLHLNDIVNDILQLSKIEERKVEFKPRAIDIVALCKEITDEFKDGPSGNRIRFECSSDSIVLFADERLIRQAFNNLVSNAIKYSPNNKPVDISITKQNTEITISVSDRGIGIPEADQKHLFTPFFRASNSRLISGNGLGLSIMRESIRMHEGDITFTSKVDQGSTFVIHLPIKREVNITKEKVIVES